ncbi:hypothetical protein CesoFtcFv8_018042 [Champsocephalus esox]|uniref:Uncharacterized protein n=1 Tax=Champsocephalus esox TaxID=159716 RepID=A0AAN8BLF7_9TELE|nr:hypothetical protein CesoFtcFv8_018042 [Champsocephalus esox]
MFSKSSGEVSSAQRPHAPDVDRDQAAERLLPVIRSEQRDEEEPLGRGGASGTRRSLWDEEEPLGRGVRDPEEEPLGRGVRDPEEEPLGRGVRDPEEEPLGRGGASGTRGPRP